MLFRALRPAIFGLDAERAHRLTVAALKIGLQRAVQADPRLSTRVAGIEFPSPIGLAAGFDKNAEVPDAMLRLGFGFVEIGTVTPRPQVGNAKPRIFRLVEDRAIINRLGFNNEGQSAAHALLAGGRRGIVGVNIGANKDAADRVADYAAGVRRMAAVADYLAINISSPNTPGLRALQDADALDDLLSAVDEARPYPGPPVFLKIAPDLDAAAIESIVAATIEHRLDGLIVSNTTVSRPRLRSAHRAESGGLSGAPLAPLALAALRDARRASKGALMLIAVGGIASADDAYARIRAGASLVQLYTALVYEGPGLPARINRGLAALLRRDGFGSVQAAVGVDAV